MQSYLNTQSIPLFETFCRRNQVDGKTITIKINDIPILVEVASTPLSQAKGFMNRDEPSGNTGIIFVYDQEQPLSFWMKNVNFDLDIIFFNSKFESINWLTMDKFKGESDYNLPRYSSHAQAQYAVELPANWCNVNLTETQCKLSF